MRALVAAVALLLSSCTIAVQEQHFFHPGPVAENERTPLPPNAEPLTIARGDATLGAVYLAHNAPLDILYLGGDSFHIDAYGADVDRAAAALPANLMLLDYRGYGRSSGTPAIESVKADAVAAFDALRERNGGRPIAVHGFSLGSFLAAHIATQRPVAGLVLESTATNVDDWAHAQIPWLAKPFIHVDIAEALRRQSNVDALRAYRGPLLLLTGSRDPITPPRFAQRLFEASPTPAAAKRVVIAPGKTHGDVLESEAAIAAYREFVKMLTSSPTPAAAGTTPPARPAGSSR